MPSSCLTTRLCTSEYSEEQDNVGGTRRLKGSAIQSGLGLRPVYSRTQDALLTALSASFRKVLPSQKGEELKVSAYIGFATQLARTKLFSVQSHDLGPYEPNNPPPAYRANRSRGHHGRHFLRGRIYHSIDPRYAGNVHQRRQRGCLWVPNPICHILLLPLLLLRSHRLRELGQHILLQSTGPFGRLCNLAGHIGGRGLDVHGAQTPPSGCRGGWNHYRDATPSSIVDRGAPPGRGQYSDPQVDGLSVRISCLLRIGTSRFRGFC
jgi:hypothetical protein